jgi:hypothetical protein
MFNMVSIESGTFQPCCEAISPTSAREEQEKWRPAMHTKCDWNNMHLSKIPLILCVCVCVFISGPTRSQRARYPERHTSTVTALGLPTCRSNFFIIANSDPFCQFVVRRSTLSGCLSHGQGPVSFQSLCCAELGRAAYFPQPIQKHPRTRGVERIKILLVVLARRRLQSGKWQVRAKYETYQVNCGLFGDLQMYFIL